MSVIEACLERIALAALRPTQATVGYREVAEKRRAFRSRTGEERNAFLLRQMTPTVLGPGGHHFIIDQHHLMRALFEEGQADASVSLVADFSRLDEPAFWAQMEQRRWVHPYDAAGRRVAFADLPQSVAGLADDPCRSLAALVRRAGGFAKDETPYSEFAWADYFRHRLDAGQLASALEGELSPVLALAQSRSAEGLPGWRGIAA